MVAGDPKKFEQAVAERRPNPLYRSVVFTTSAMTAEQLPRDSEIEVAIAGRSNAGKSTVINAITGNTKLARISKTPGRTQAINCFQVQPGKYLVDLPGYGYAKVSQRQREHWNRELGHYFATASVLRGLLLVMDIRRPLTELDWGMLALLDPATTDVHCLLSKADKLGRGPARSTVLKTAATLEKRGIVASVQAFSAPAGTGLGECTGVLDRWFDVAPPE